MLRALNRALRAEQQVMTAPAAPGQGQSITEKVLQIMEIVLSEASHLPPDRYTVCYNTLNFYFQGLYFQ